MINWIIAFSGLVISSGQKILTDKKVDYQEIVKIVISIFSVVALMLVFINEDTAVLLAKWFGFKELHPDSLDFILRLGSLLIGLLNFAIIIALRRKAKSKLKK